MGSTEYVTLQRNSRGGKECIMFDIGLKEDLQMFKAHPVPHTGIAFQPRLERHTTNLAPFSFEERMRVARLKKEEKIQDYLNEEKKVNICFMHHSK